MNISQYKKSATLIRHNSTYKVYDLMDLKGLILSLTELRPQKETNGHAHDDADEVYFFVKGAGKMKNGDKTIRVKAGDVVLVHRGDFHQVINPAKTSMSFWCVFQKYESRGKH